MSNIFVIRRILILLITCYFFFFLGNSIIQLTDPDEVFYSLTAKEMAQQKEWLVPYIFDKPHFEKPVFTFWLLRVAFDMWGETPFSARFFPALFACFGVLGVYALGLLGFRHERKAFYAALMLCTAGLYVGMAKTVFTDMIFTVFILYAMLSFYLAFIVDNFKRNGMLLFFLFIAMATLTKGPLALIIAEMTVILFLLYIRNLDFIKSIWMPLGFGLFVLVASPWYMYMYQHHGNDFIQEFFYNDHWRRVIEAEHKGNDTWYFYPLTILLGFFPWTLFVGMAFIELFKKLKTGLVHFEYFCLSWILVVFIIFQVGHSKLTSYILPMFPAVALLAASLMVDMVEKNYKAHLAKGFATVMGIFIIVMGAMVFPAYPIYKKYVLDMTPLYFISGALLTLGTFSLVNLFKEQFFRCVVTISLLPVVLLWGMFLLKKDVQPFISIYDAVQYLPTPNPGTTVLTAKPYARGLKYFSGYDVSVVNINGQNYFSPHPINVLTSKDELANYLQNQKTTFAILETPEYKDVTHLIKGKFQVTVLKQIAHHYVVKIEAVS